MSRISKNELQALYNPTYELEQQKGLAKYMRAMHRLANDKNLEFITNEIYNNIIEVAKKGQQSHTTTIIEDGAGGEISGLYFNEINCNGCIDISDNYIIDVFSNPILAISNNNLYDMSGSELGNLIISNMNIQGELDISGANVVVDASNNVLFKVSGTNVLGADDSILGTITEEKLSTRVLNCMLEKFDGVTGEIQTPMLLMSEENSTPVNKSLIFNWSE
jgi:hypothetical protein